MRSISEFVKTNLTFSITLFLSFIFFLLRFPSLFEPNWYGDEGIYQAIGISLRAGEILYKDIWDNKPPMLYLLYAVFNANQFAIRLLSLIFGIGAIISFYFLARLLIKKNKVVFLISVLFTLFLGSPILEGNIANAEVFMLFPILLAGLVLFALRHKILVVTTNETLKQKIMGGTLPRKYFFFSGLLLGLAFMLKTVALFDVLAFFFFFLFVIYIPDRSFSFFKINSYLPEVKKIFYIFLPFFSAFLLPFFIFILYFMINQSLSSFLSSVFLQNIDYIGYQNSFIIPQGLIIIKTLLLLTAFIFIFYFRQKLNPEEVFILLWFIFSVYNIFFSHRPYTHYVLLILPSLFLLLGLILTKAYRYRRNFLICFLLFNVFLLIYFASDVRKNSFSYYTNFILFMQNRKSLSAYQEFFDKTTPRNYAIASYIKTHTAPGDKVFYWGNSAQLYALSHKIPPVRYTVAYHIAYNKSAVSETNLALERANPKYIVVLPDEPNRPFSLIRYQYKLSLDDVTIYEKIY